MKLLVLFAVLAGCGAPPADDTEAVQSNVIVTSPLGLYSSQWIYIAQEFTSGHPNFGHSGVLFVRDSDRVCSWLNLDDASQYIVTDTEVYGSYLGDAMYIVRAQTTVPCSGGGQYVLRPFYGSQEVKVTMRGLSGDDFMSCAGSNFAGYSKNECYGDYGNDYIVAFDTRNVIHGGPDDDSLRPIGNTFAKAYGDDGNDCINRDYPRMGITDCGQGTDRVTYTQLGTIACENLSADYCGWPY